MMIEPATTPMMLTVDRRVEWGLQGSFEQQLKLGQ